MTNESDWPRLSWPCWLNYGGRYPKHNMQLRTALSYGCTSLIQLLTAVFRCTSRSLWPKIRAQQKMQLKRRMVLTVHDDDALCLLNLCATEMNPDISSLSWLPKPAGLSFDWLHYSKHLFFCFTEEVRTICETHDSVNKVKMAFEEKLQCSAGWVMNILLHFPKRKNSF